MQNAVMPRKAEPFGHFRFFRLGFNLKLPLSEKAIIRAFSKDPGMTFANYSRRGADPNTLGAIKTAKENFDESLKSNHEPGKEISNEMAGLSFELLSIAGTRDSVYATYLRYKSYVGLSEKEQYLGSVERFDAEINSINERLLRRNQTLFRVKKAAAMSKAIPVLMEELASAKEKNKSGIIV